MATTLPTSSVKLREVIGVEQFCQRREVFDQHDTVFLPQPSAPASPQPAYRHLEPIITSNHGKTTANFKRNAPFYSSMRESRAEDRNLEFRTRKYSDNFTSELNQSDEVDYRHSMTERTRRLSKLRRDFLNSNLHDPNSEGTFSRTGVRASLPASSVIKYKIESPNLYKFPFAEPYATPPPVRRVVVDLGPAGVNGEKENRDPKAKTRHQSLPSNEFVSPKADPQKLFEELMKRYSPQRKPVDWSIPATRPRVVGSVPKSYSSVTDSVDSTDKKVLEEHKNKTEDDDVFLKSESKVHTEVTTTPNDKSTHDKQNSKRTSNKSEHSIQIISEEVVVETPVKEEETKTSSESDEKKDKVPELSTLHLPNMDGTKRPSLDKYVDMNIPALIEKMTEEAEELEHKKPAKKVKRKRSFLDKLLGRKKDK